MSTKLIKNSRLTIYRWCSLLFILVFLQQSASGDQQASATSSSQLDKQPNKQDSQQQPNNQINAQASDPVGHQLSASYDGQQGRHMEIKIRKQRNSFMKKELTHQNHHFHSNYYSSIPIVSSASTNHYRSSLDSIYLNEQQSDAYDLYRSLHNRSLLTSGDSLGSYLGASHAGQTFNLLQQTSSSSRLNKLSHHASSSSSVAIQGPLFQADLPARVSFSNNTGLVLNCAATGQQTPMISWQTETGISVLSPSQSINSLNLLNDNSKYLNLPLVHQNPATNALVFRSFAADEFSPEVHSIKYRCLATNQHGTITSPLIQIKAVIKQPFQIEVPDEYVTLKSTAVFRCQVPNQLKDQLQVLSWLEEPGGRSYSVPSHSFSKYSSFTVPSSHIEPLINGSQYLTLPTGELYINQVDFTTAKKRFRCKVKNKLTGETITSVTSGKLIITEAHTASQLRITDYRDKVNARLGYQSLSDDLDRTRSQNDLAPRTDKNDEYAILVCNAQSQPLPTYTWYRAQSNGQRTPVSPILDLNSDHQKASNSRLHPYAKQATANRHNNSIDNSLQKQTDLLAFNLEPLAAGDSVLANRIQSFKYIQWAGVLFIRHFNLRDDGLYTCVVNNTYDEERLDTRLSVQGDTKLPFHQRQKIVSNGTLEIVQVEKGTDESSYTCQALAHGKNAQSTFYVNVIVKPTIEPFEFPKHLREGQRASVTCTVSSGDLPICLNWYHQGEPIEKLNKTVLTKSISAYSSTLLFESLSLIHSGNYTCTAQNDAGEVSHSAVMQVNVQPRWLVEPLGEYSVVRGKSISIDCQSLGYPLPNHAWTKAEGNSPKDFKPIVSNPHLQVYENGSLTFVDARDVDRGYYLCAASNNIGPGLSKVVKINVNVAAHFKTKFSVDTKQKGEHVRLKCESLGDKPLKISWFKDKQRIEIKSIEMLADQSLQSLQPLHSELVLQDSSRYEITDKLTDQGLISYLDISKAERKDSGLFSCFAYNQHGHDDTNTQLIVQERPDAPADIQVVEINARSVKLSCQAPFNGNLPIISYLVQYSTDQASLQIADQAKAVGKVQNLTIKSSECSAHLSQLKPARTYYVRLIAENRLGASDPSSIVDVATDEDLPTAPPTKLKSTVLSSKQVKVSWKSPDESTLNGQLKGFYVGFRLLNGNNNKEQFVYKTVEATGKNEGGLEQVCSTTLSNLRKNSKYAIIVQAFNNKGTGPSSEELFVQTAELDPPESPQLHVASTTVNTIHLTWQPSQLDENPIDGYLLFQKEENSLEWKEYSLDAQQTFYTTLGLKCGTRYLFYLVAYNKQGRGEPSETITVKTDGGLPVAPDKKSALSVNTSSVVVKLDAWHHGGCQILGFRIRYKLHGAKEWTQVSNNDQTGVHQHNPNGGGGVGGGQHSLDSSMTDINNSNAQQLSSTNAMSNSISMMANGFYSLPRQQEASSSSSVGIPSAVNINDLQPGRKYLIQVSVGSTDAEYNVNTYSMISNELMRSSTVRLLQHGQQLSAQLADYTYLLPVCLSLMIITVLLLMVCVIVRRNNQLPNASTSLLYGSIVGSRKEQEQLQMNAMANFSTLSTNKAKQMSCDGNLNCDTMGHLLITANGTICETMPKLNNGQLESNGTGHQHHTGLEPLYAIVKRTPRAMRNPADPHIYSYPVQMNGNLTAMNTLNNTLNNLNNLTNLSNALANGSMSCNQYSANTYGSNPCNGNQCGNTANQLTNASEITNCAINYASQMNMDAPCVGLCNLDEQTSNKLMNCSNEYNNSSSCNTSMNSAHQLMNNSLTNGVNKAIMCAGQQYADNGDHQITTETNNKFPIELDFNVMF